MYPLLIPVLLVAIVNVIALFVMAKDKQLSISNAGSDRIPEGVLFFLATIGGSIGIYMGMFLFRHKTRKWYFTIGIPLLIMENAATAYTVYNYLSLIQIR